MRIISGYAKGKKLVSPAGLNTRPTLDRVRESIFGSIQFDIPESTVLDLFSGSGAMGLEAASRGAAHVVLNDISAESVKCIRENIKNTGLGDCVELFQMDYLQLIDYLGCNNIKFDFAFIDAPYYTDLSWTAADSLFSRGLISDGGSVICEHASDETVRPGEFYRVCNTRMLGKCGYSVLKGKES